MPSESRILNFGKTEVFEALREYCAHTTHAIPEDALTGLVSFNDSQAQVVVNDGGSKSTHNFNESELGAALIMFCINKSIPIAKRSEKSLQFKTDSVSLHLELRH